MGSYYIFEGNSNIRNIRNANLILNGISQMYIVFTECSTMTIDLSQFDLILASFFGNNLRRNIKLV